MKWKNCHFAVVFIFFLTGVFSFSSCRFNQGKRQEGSAGADTVAVAPPVYKYGLPIDSFHVEIGTIGPNQHLSHILGSYGVAMGIIDQIARQSKDIFDVRKIRKGQKYAVFQTQDSINETRFFVYENSATDFYVFELFDSLKVYRGENEIVRKLRTGYGEINSSLWNTMKDNNLDPMLALKLSDIFAWTIDFYAIQKGDQFRVIYDELVVDSAYVGVGEIYAVQFDHAGTENFAFGFEQDERFDYFDENGMSLRRAFLKSPLEFSRISSHFSHSRLHPVLRIRRPHHGVDYAAPHGTPVRSIGDGTVVARAYQAGGAGNYVKIKHNSVYTTTYMHLSGFGKGVATGSRVKQGQVIGFVGATGLATGPHLDFRVHKNGSPVDPLKVEAPPVEPVHQEKMDEYVLLKDSLLTELKKIIPAQPDVLAELPE